MTEGMRQLPLSDMPLNVDAKQLLDRLATWSAGGVGGMSFGTLIYQTGWVRDRVSEGVQELLDAGVIIKQGPCGEYYVRAKWEHFFGK
jgi:hypothetical protein